MKLHFEPNLDYQLQAIEAVCGLFHGQETCRTEFTVTRDAASGQMSLLENDLGIGNRLTLLDDELLANLHAIQLRHGLAPSASLASGDFTVEMETGTGKTYVYLRTVFELNKRYGFTKFVIVVPSVAIKEGVYHTIETAAEHLKGLYAGAPFDFFIYDSAKLGQVRNFATSPQIQIMVMTVGAINKFGDEQQAQTEEADEAARREKSKNVMYRPSEKTGGEKPIDLIRATRPILIVDEPQSVEGGLDGKGKKAMERMNPLCNLRYSATPKEAHHMVFKLDAVDAYERKLVKQIEVAAASVEGGHNKAVCAVHRAGVPWQGASSAPRWNWMSPPRTASPGKRSPWHRCDKLEEVTKREIYRDHIIGQEIRDARDDKFMELRYPGGEQYLRPGEAYGDVDALAVQRQMIHRTIKEHLDKEKRLRPQGIKVLSLFFIDAVEKYRQYDADGNPVKGDYARIFEEEYRRLAKHPDYQTLFKEVDLTTAAEDVHNGYFSIDRKKVGSKTVEVFKDTKGTTQADDDTYSLIMRDKEKLLSFDTPLKFIFSHSALTRRLGQPERLSNLRAAGDGFRAAAPPDHRARLASVREPERRAPARLRDQHADGDRDRELRAVRRETPEGDRGRNRHPLRHRGGAPVRRSHRHRSRRPARAAGLRPVEGAVGALENRRSRERPRQGAGRAAQGAQGRHADPAGAVRRPTAAGEGDSPQAGRTPGDQERRRAQAGEDAARPCCKARTSRRCGTASSTRPPTACSSTTRRCWRPASRRLRTRRPSPRPACNGARPTSPLGAPAWTRRRRPPPPR